MKSLHVIARVDVVSEVTSTETILNVCHFLQVKCDCGEQVEKMNLEEHKVSCFK